MKRRTMVLQEILNQEYIKQSQEINQIIKIIMNLIVRMSENVHLAEHIESYLINQDHVYCLEIFNHEIKN